MESLEVPAPSITPQTEPPLSGEIDALREELLQVQAQMHSLQARVDAGQSPILPATDAPVQTDIHIIRENLDEIHRIVVNLAGKR
jgi:hypothetical protein